LNIDNPDAIEKNKQNFLKDFESFVPQKETPT
jgi:hypothetical protein